RLEIVTGTAPKALNIRPMVLEFFRKRECVVSEKGATVIVDIFE
ncbi:hypothetical protein M153_62520001235, partial [Pseudoloma neurophilia]